MTRIYGVLFFQRAEIIPTLPVQDNACEGKWYYTFLCGSTHLSHLIHLNRLSPMCYCLRQLKFLITILFFCCFLTTVSIAQSILHGTITNIKDGTPVRGASITIENSLLTSITDVEGHFTIKIKNETDLQAVISHVSFEKKKIALSISSENKISLEPKIYLADEVTIYSTRVDKKTGAAFNNISKEELAKVNLGQDLPILLNNLPSVVTTSDAGGGVGYTGIRVRGNDASRVNVTINGIPINDAESHQVYWVDLPDLASSVDNIQFQRGLGSSTNGAGAFGASLNLQTTKISQSPYGSLSSSFGSFNTNKNSVAFGTGVLNNHFTVDGRMSLINSDGYIDRASSALRSLYLSGGYYDSKQFLRAVIITGKERTYQAWYGISQDSVATNRTYNPAGEYYDALGNAHYYNNQTDNYQQDYYQLFYSRTLTPNITANVGLHYTKGKGYYEEFKQDESFGSYGLNNLIFGTDTVDHTNLLRRKWLSNDFYGATWSFDYSKNSLDIKFGGAGNKYIGRHYNEIIAATISPIQTFPYTYYDDTANKTDVNFYLKSDYHFNKKLTVTLDLQERIVNYDFSKLLPAGTDNAKLNFFNPKIGFNYSFNNKNEIYFYVGAGHKEPIRDDYLVSTINSRPQPESLVDYETGYNFAGNQLAFSVNGYFMNYQNQLILTGKINDVGEYIRENVKDSYRAGVETQVTYKFTKDFSFNGNITVSENKIKSFTEYVDDYDGGQQYVNNYENTTISFSPSTIVAGSLNYKLLKNIDLNLNTKYVGKQYLDNSTNESRKIDGYFVTNFRTNYSLPVKGLRSLEFSLMINNIFSELYNANGYSYSGYISGKRSDYNFYYPQAKLNWLGGVTIKF